MLKPYFYIEPTTFAELDNIIAKWNTNELMLFYFFISGFRNLNKTLENICCIVLECKNNK